MTEHERDFTASTIVKESPSTAFRLIARVSEWWVADVEGEAVNLGDEFTVRSGTTWMKFKVVEVVPNVKLVWRVVDCYLPWNADKTEWNDTSVVWELSAMADGTQVKFIHQGLVPEVECYSQCAKSWSSYIKESLNNFIKTGVGLPNRF